MLGHSSTSGQPSNWVQSFFALSRVTGPPLAFLPVTEWQSEGGAPPTNTTKYFSARPKQTYRRRRRPITSFASVSSSSRDLENVIITIAIERRRCLPPRRRGRETFAAGSIGGIHCGNFPPPSYPTATDSLYTIDTLCYFLGRPEREFPRLPH